MGLNRDKDVENPGAAPRPSDARAAAQPKPLRPLTPAQIEAIRANVRYLKTLREREDAAGGAADE